MVIYDDLVAETLIQPLPEQRDEELAADREPPTVHDATSCDVCKAWLAHVRDAEAR